MFRKIKQFIRREPLLLAVVAVGITAGALDYSGRPNLAWWLIFITGIAVLIRSTLHINNVIRHGYFGITLLPVIALLTALILRETWTALLLQFLLITEQPLVANLDKYFSRSTPHARITKTQHSSLHRLFDRLSLPFTVVVLLIAGASWLLNNDASLFLSTTAIAAVWPLLFVTPLLYVAALAGADQRSLFIRSAAVLEDLANAKYVFIRKAGIVTSIEGVDTITALGKNKKSDVLRLAASLAASSDHALSRAITDHALQSHKINPAKHTKEAPGMGVTGRMRGQAIRIGSALFLEQSGVDVVAKKTSQAKPTVYVAQGEQLIGYITFKESLLPGAKNLSKQLRKIGITKLTLLSNDSDASVAATAKNINATELFSACSSDQTVKMLHDATNRPNVFVGGDTQDDAGLVAANVGVVTRSDGPAHSDVILQNYNVHDIATVLRLCKQTLRRSLTSTVLLTAVALASAALAATGFFTPIQAVLVHVGILALSVVTVRLNATTIK